jgi:hypothetical protein
MLAQGASHGEYSVGSLFCGVRYVVHASVRGIPWRIIYRYSFLCMLSKKEMNVPEIQDEQFVGASPFFSNRRRTLHGRVYLLLRYETRVSWARLPFSSSETELLPDSV